MIKKSQIDGELMREYFSVKCSCASPPLYQEVIEHHFFSWNFEHALLLSIDMITYKSFSDTKKDRRSRKSHTYDVD